MSMPDYDRLEHHLEHRRQEVHSNRRGDGVLAALLAAG
jgi:hypothetical protein